ncbi:MAG: AAA family ATPase, partial [Pseudohongiella sp.]|nr:AAA family ATPase [Pseudohongiella sp.]
MPTVRRSHKNQKSSDVAELVQLWLLRLLVPLGGHRDFITQDGFCNDALATAVGLEKWIAPAPLDFDPKAVRAELRKLHEAGEKKLRNATSPACLKRNVARLTDLVGLSNTDCRILEFTVLLYNERVLDDAADLLEELSSVKVFRTLAVLLDIPEHHIRSSLSAKSILCKSGMVVLDRGNCLTLSRKLDLLSGSFSEDIFCSDADPVSLLRDMVALSSPAQLKISDYEHIAPSLAVLRPYLRRSFETGRRGV